jgi:hypothetical protein
MEGANYHCRTEELPFLGKLVINSFIRDKDDFIARLQ